MKRIIWVVLLCFGLVLAAQGVVSADGSYPSGTCTDCCVGQQDVTWSTCVCEQKTCGDTSGKYCVRYHTNNCLESGPVDTRTYSYGETVTVLFDPVIYKANGTIFHGWSHYPYGPAQYGYAYNQFRMPNRDVDLYAICITPYYGPPAPPCQGCTYPPHYQGNWPNWNPPGGVVP